MRMKLNGEHRVSLLTTKMLEVYDVVQVMQELVADANQFDRFKETLAHNQDKLNQKYGTKAESLLHRACYFNNKKALRLLLDNGADINIRNGALATPLHVAVEEEKVDLARMLLKVGANVTIEDSNSNTPIHLAARIGNMEIIKMIVEAEAPLHSRGFQGNSCLHMAAEFANYEAIEYFLSRGIKPDTTNNLTQTPLHMVGACFARDRSRQCAELLLNSGANLNARTEWGDTVIHPTAMYGAVDMLEYLLDEGISIAKEGNTSASEICAKNGLAKEAVEEFDLSLLTKVVMSRCIEKNTLIIDRMLAARNQSIINDYLLNFKQGNLKGFLKRKELTVQQNEFLKMTEELKEEMCHQDSLFKKIIKFSPDVLTYLFDKCLINPIEVQVQGRIYFDFFLFEVNNNSEMEIFKSLVLADKQKFMIHPLLDMFLKLKRNCVNYIFWLYFLLAFYYNFTIIFFSLQHFSSIKSVFGDNNISWYMAAVGHAIITFENTIFIVGMVDVYRKVFKTRHQTGHFCWKMTLTASVNRIKEASIAVLFGFLLYHDMNEDYKRILASILIYLVSEKQMKSLTKIPRFGMQSLMFERVSHSIFFFITSYSLTIIAFCLIFHILLSNSPAFTSLFDSLIKIQTMLMGEYDFTANFINAPNPTLSVMAKIFFVIFLYNMSLALMNLVLGLAVSDISALQKTSKMKSAAIESFLTGQMENVIRFLRKMPGLCQMISSPMITERNDECLYYYLDLVDADGTNMMYCEAPQVGVVGKMECPKEIAQEVALILIKRIQETRKKKCQIEKILETLEEVKQSNKEMRNMFDDIVMKIKHKNTITVK